jgi:predicted nucleic acid-binding protein
MAAAQALRFAELLQPLVELSTDDLRLGLSLWQRHEQLSSLDAILAASCLNSNSTLVSADKAFAHIRGLDHVVPDARGVTRLIAG